MNEIVVSKVARISRLLFEACHLGPIQKIKKALENPFDIPIWFCDMS